MEVKKMAYTRFGEVMRILRIKHHEVMGDTAKLLNVTTPFMSAVENGKRNVPDGWFNILIDHYNLSVEEQQELQEAIDASKTQIKINLIQTEKFKREMALQVARSFDDMDEDTALKIINLLNNKGEN